MGHFVNISLLQTQDESKVAYNYTHRFNLSSGVFFKTPKNISGSGYFIEVSVKVVGNEKTLLLPIWSYKGKNILIFSTLVTHLIGNAKI